MKRILIFFLFSLIFGVMMAPRPVTACGGLFCQNSPVDQNAERIIFTQNNDGTVSAIIQIQYQGFAEDFSWILPLPTPITADQVQVPEEAMDAFTELELATNPRFIPPPTPPCANITVEVEVEVASVEDSGVDVFASGEVGPYAFDVIGSEDPMALITWLRDNNYRVEESMEPLINVYVEEQFVFLAMKLQPDQGSEDIQPVKVTYNTDFPMIPLRLTAVAATPDMAVLTWFFADEQAVPSNFAHMEVADEDITFFTFGRNNYRQLMADTANQFGGQAFITEYAQPTSEQTYANPLLQELASDYAYLTRLNTVISPEEMTLDPVFGYDGTRENVSNVHDLSEMTGLYDCEQLEATEETATTLANTEAEPVVSNEETSTTNNTEDDSDSVAEANTTSSEETMSGNDGETTTSNSSNGEGEAVVEGQEYDPIANPWAGYPTYFLALLVVIVILVAIVIIRKRKEGAE